MYQCWIDLAIAIGVRHLFQFQPLCLFLVMFYSYSIRRMVCRLQQQNIRLVCWFLQSLWNSPSVSYNRKVFPTAMIWVLPNLTQIYHVTTTKPATGSRTTGADQSSVGYNVYTISVGEEGCKSYASTVYATRESSAEL